MSSRKVVWTRPYAHPQHIKIVKHLIYIILMLDEYWLGVQTESPHFTMSYCLGVAQISDKIPKAWSGVTIAWWGHIHMHIHSI